MIIGLYVTSKVKQLKGSDQNHCVEFLTLSNFYGDRKIRRSILNELIGLIGLIG